MKCSVIIPTYNGGSVWKQCVESLSKQKANISHIQVVDSSSCDDTVAIANGSNLSVTVIDSKDFNHGGTRNLATKLCVDSDVIVFITQDAVLDNEFSISSILEEFEDPKVSAVCGRQIPHYDANPLAEHARFFNYPDFSCKKTSNDISELGIKVAFMSNSFSAYRRSVFEELGGFPNNTILAEDMYLTSKMILAGYKISYCAGAVARHSHNYSPWQEFQRYFDTGVFHSCEPWIQEQLGGASGEGLKFVKSELKFLLTKYPLWIPRSIFTNFLKIFGYKLGKQYRMLPLFLCRYFSMCKSYWVKNH